MNKNNTEANQDGLLNVTQVAKLLGTHPNTVKRWSNKGLLKTYRFGSRGDRRYRHEDIEKFFSRGKVQNSPVPLASLKTDDITVLIIGKPNIFRTGVRRVMEQLDNIKIKECDPELDPASFVGYFEPDIVFITPDLPNYQQMEIGLSIMNSFRKTRVIVLESDTRDNELLAILRNTVNCARSKCGVFNCLGTIHRMPSVNTELESLEDPLTPRELQILDCIASGHSTNKQVADVLKLNEQTIKNYTSSLFRKLHANDRTHAIVVAIRHGLISLGPVASTTEPEPKEKLEKLSKKLEVTDKDRKTLEELKANPDTPERLVRRADIILAFADGLNNKSIVEKDLCSEPTAIRWRRRFAKYGVEGLKRYAKN